MGIYVIIHNFYTRIDLFVYIYIKQNVGKSQYTQIFKQRSKLEIKEYAYCYRNMAYHGAEVVTQ